MNCDENLDKFNFQQNTSTDIIMVSVTPLSFFALKWLIQILHGHHIDLVFKSLKTNNIN